VGVTEDVGQRLLKDPEDGASQVVRDRDAITRHLHRDLDTGARLKLLPLPLERGRQTQVIQHARPKRRGDAAHGVRGLIDSLDDRRALRDCFVIARKTVLHPRDVQLKSGQRLTELIVDFPRDPGALFLAHLLKARRQGAELLARGAYLLADEILACYVALDAELTRDATTIIVDHHVVAFDAHRSAVQTTLVGFGMDMTPIEELAPPRFRFRQIMRQELRGSPPQKLFRHRGVELRQNGRVHLRHAQMLEHIIEHLVLADVIPPFHGLVQHHEEEPVHGLSEEPFEQSFVFDDARNRHVARHPWEHER